MGAGYPSEKFEQELYWKKEMRLTEVESLFSVIPGREEPGRDMCRRLTFENETRVSSCFQQIYLNIVALLHHVIKDTKEMANRTGQNEKMPDRMIKREISPKEKYNTQRIKNSSKHKPKDSTEFKRII